MEQNLLIALIIISIILSVLSIAYIVRIAFLAFLPFIHITCLAGSSIILILSILDLLRVLNKLELTGEFSSIYFLCTSLTSILSCYVLLQVGMNFYQDYNFLKTLLMFAPIIVSMGVFALSVFAALRMILNKNDQIEEVPKLRDIIFILSAISGLLSLTYGIIPLFTIRSQTMLRPQQTAVSIVQLFIVVTFFLAHFIVYTFITFRGSILNMDYNPIRNMVLILIFPGCSFSPPRGMVKFVKRRALGVEEFTIGGDFRPDTLPDNYTNRSESPLNPGTDYGSSRNTSRIKLLKRLTRLTSSLPPLPKTSTSSSRPSVISPPTPLPRSIPNSTSPKQREPYFDPQSRSHARSRSNNVFNTMNTSSVNSVESDTSFYISKFFNNPGGSKLKTKNINGGGSSMGYSQSDRQHPQHPQYPQYPQYPQPLQFPQPPQPPQYPQYPQPSQPPQYPQPSQPPQYPQPLQPPQPPQYPQPLQYPQPPHRPQYPQFPQPPTRPPRPQRPQHPQYPEFLNLL